MNFLTDRGPHVYSVLHGAMCLFML